MLDYTRVLKKIVPEQDGPSPTYLRTGTVVADNGDGTAALTLADGVTILPSVAVLNGVTLTAGMIVQVLTFRGGLLILGPSGSRPPVTTPLTRLAQQVSQTGIASGATAVLTFGPGSEIVDTDNYHSETVNNTRVTPTRPGWYRVVVKVVAEFNSAIISQNAAVLKNGSVIDRSGNHRPNTSNVNSGTILETWVDCNGSTDYIEGAISCATTGAVTWNTNVSANTLNTLTVEWVRDLSPFTGGGIVTPPVNATFPLVQALFGTPSIPNATPTSLTPSSVPVNVGPMWTSGSTFSIPPGQGGLYELGIACQFTPQATASGIRYGRFLVNGSEYALDGINAVGLNNIATPAFATARAQLNGGDTIAFSVFQNTGGALALTGTSHGWIERKR